MCHQRLIRGDDMFTVLERCIEHSTGNTLRAADQFDDNVNLGIGGHRNGIFVPPHGREIDTAIAPPIARRYRNNNNPSPGAPSDDIGLPVQQLQHTRPNRTETRDGDLQRRLHDNILGPVRKR